MFSLPQPDRQQEGLVDDKPIRLGEIMGVSLREVESLLRFMYQRCATRGGHIVRLVQCSHRPTNGRHKASLEEWKALLRIATLLDCQDIREHAIWEISRDKSVTAIQTIILGHKYEVVKWLWVGYRALCMRDPPLTLPEAQELGLEETVRVSEGREKFIKSSRRVWGSEEAMNQVMLEVFGLSVSGNEVNA